MSTRSESIGKHVINSIDEVEARAINGVHGGADSARKATKAGSRWASRQETNAARKVRVLQRRLEQQTALLGKLTGKSVDAVTDTAKQAAVAGGRYIKKNPWQTIAIASAGALLLGALLGRRQR